MKKEKENYINDKLLTVSEIAEIFRVGRSKAYDIVGKREIPYIRIGREIRFRRSDIDAYLKSKTQNVQKFDFNVADFAKAGAK